MGSERCIRDSNTTVAAAVDKTIDNPAAITDFLKKTASDLGATGTASMNNTQLINAIKIANDTAVAAAQKATDDLAASAVKVVTDAAAAKAAARRPATNHTAYAAATECAADAYRPVSQPRGSLSA